MSRDPVPTPKRLPPDGVKPATLGALRFEAVHWGKERGLGQNGGYVVALDASSGEELWLLKIYDVRYQEPMEEDVQDVFIRRLESEGEMLVITDERGARYLANPNTRAVTKG